MHPIAQLLPSTVAQPMRQRAGNVLLMVSVRSTPMQCGLVCVAALPTFLVTLPNKTDFPYYPAAGLPASILLLPFLSTVLMKLQYQFRYVSVNRSMCRDWIVCWVGKSIH